MPSNLTWPQALAWRMQRQLLDPVGTGSVADVVERLGAVPAWPDATAEQTIGARRQGARAGDAAGALAAGEVVKVYAFRGATHLMTPRDAGSYLAVKASNRQWELASWQSFYDLTASEWPSFRAYVRRALADGPLTRSELVAALGRSSRYRHVREAVADGSDTIVKPLCWHGDVGMGPPREGETTFLALDGVPGWAGIPDLDDAGPTVIEAYLRTYGPATAERIGEWFKGLSAKPRHLTAWLAALEERLATVTVDGEECLVLATDVDELRATSASTAVRLLPGRDPWVMAPGTSDTRVVPAARRELVSRSANLVVARGVVSGTWTARGEALDVAWFEESGRVPRTGLDQEAARLAAFLDRPLDLSVSVG